MINQVVFAGKVSSDIRYGKTKTGKSYAFINAVSPKSYLGEETKHTFALAQFSAFGKIADYLCMECKKGDFAVIHAHIETDTKMDLRLIVDKVKVFPQIEREPLNQLGGEEFEEIVMFEPEGE